MQLTDLHLQWQHSAGPWTPVSLTAQLSDVRTSETLLYLHDANSVCDQHVTAVHAWAYRCCWLGMLTQCW